VEAIFDRADAWVQEGRDVEVLTVDNYADGPALHLRLAGRGDERAEVVERALTWNGGARNAAGVGLAAVDWEGWVRPDQFWPGAALGNVRARALSRIWSDPPPPLRALRGRAERLSGRCRTCRFLPMCGGGLASRALSATGSLDAPDPACHLTDAEIGAAA
jgi:radical SAM protein with 4Fe4S-binding SPASM domain